MVDRVAPPLPAMSLTVIDNFVKVRGVVEIQFHSDDPTAKRAPPIDLFDVQTRGGIPRDIGKKDKYTTEQAVFQCLVCDCTLKSIATMKAHCKGVPHFRKECTLMSQLRQQRKKEEAEAQAQTAPWNGHASSSGTADSAANLKDVVARANNVPLLGLKYLVELRHPRVARPLYRCTLPLCQDFTCTALVMRDHLLCVDHLNNYFNVTYGKPVATVSDLRSEAVEEAANINMTLEATLQLIVRRESAKEYVQAERKLKKKVENVIIQVQEDIPGKSNGCHSNPAWTSFARDPHMQLSSSVNMMPDGSKRRRMVDMSIVAISDGEDDDLLVLEDIKPSQSRSVAGLNNDDARTSIDLVTPPPTSDELEPSVSPPCAKPEQLYVDTTSPLSLPAVTPAAAAPPAPTTGPVPDATKVAVNLFHRKMADVVIRSLKPFYTEAAAAAANSGLQQPRYERKIATKEAFSDLAKKLSHKFREEEKASHVARNLALETITVTPDMDNRINVQVEMEMEKYPPLKARFQ